MDRCKKLIVSLFVLAYVLIPIHQVNAHIVIGVYEDEAEFNKYNPDSTAMIEEYIKTKTKSEEENLAKEDKDEEKENDDKEEKKEVINITDDELVLLSKLVSSEARGESYEGQVAVAAVVINRVKDDRFPDNIRDVIYQKNAFSVVNNGTINMEYTDSAYEAAKEALYGEDPTNDSVFFWNPAISTCSWIKQLDPHLRIGNHVFAK